MNCKRWLALTLVWLIALPAASGLAQEDDSVALTCWVYYNGVQEQMFSSMVQEFNDTVGVEEGIFVDYKSLSTISELNDQVRASAQNEPGADPLPDIYGAYADTAYAMWKMGVVADLSPYLTQEELQEYVDAYIEEGRMGDERQLCILPIAKSTELLLLNQTDWAAFQTATGAEEAKLSTWEGLAELAGEYFRWTDEQTPQVEGDGQAFFGRDAMANYVLVGAVQLGSEIFQVEGEQMTLNFDRDVMRRIWDCFYVPYMSGWFTAEGRYRSDDIKTGRIIALVGSSSGAFYFPSEVTFDDGTTKAIEGSVRPLPNFADTEPFAVQQGAGMVVTKSTPEVERAAVTFLRWMARPEQNIAFSAGSGYLPITKAGNAQESIAKALEVMGVSGMERQIVETGAAISRDYHLYTNKPFANGYEARQILEDTLLEAAQAADAQREELMANGMSYAQAVEALNTEEAFTQWYETTKALLEQAVK